MEHLVKRGGFLPFAVSAADGEPISIEMLGEKADARRTIDLLWDSLRARRDDLVAAAVVADVRLGGDGWPDGIQVEAEHRDGIVLSIVAPYRRRRLRRDVELEEFGLAEGQRRLW
ncbi:hypothetical protein ABZX12_06165 [Kribbella sp. NPDC003505]|uniref:hypothetical protein n=1 Tax=Kribbella sp. NPDC003505 TaxID=3154448 RepID=UPI0033ACEF72